MARGGLLQKYLPDWFLSKFGFLHHFRVSRGLTKKIFSEIYTSGTNRISGFFTFFDFLVLHFNIFSPKSICVFLMSCKYLKFFSVKKSFQNWHRYASLKIGPKIDFFIFNQFDHMMFWKTSTWRADSKSVKIFEIGCKMTEL